MRYRYFLLTIISAIGVLMLVVLDSMGFALSDTRAQSNKNIEAQVFDSADKALSSLSTETKTVESESPPLQDGQAVLNSHCSQCHVPQSLEQTKRSSTEWEKALEQMEAMGINLAPAEKSVLIDYLSRR